MLCRQGNRNTRNPICIRYLLAGQPEHFNIKNDVAVDNLANRMGRIGRMDTNATSASVTLQSLPEG